jgi:ferredoxin-NADP reductase
MTRPAAPANQVHVPGPWQMATVVQVHAETASAKTFTLRLPDRPPLLPGQHYIVRLTAPDGYRAQRSYSVASAPGGDTIDLTVEHLPDGEVSGFLHEAVIPGDMLEVRGPIGYFAWDSKTPVLGVAGGSGVVPVMAMLRTARLTGQPGLVRLVVSVRTPADLYYSRELPGADAAVVYTRQTPPGFSRPAGRLTLADLAPSIRANQVAYICGSPAFCDGATSLLSELGVPTASMKVERFGPTG